MIWILAAALIWFYVAGIAMVAVLARGLISSPDGLAVILWPVIMPLYLLMPPDRDTRHRD